MENHEKVLSSSMRGRLEQAVSKTASSENKAMTVRLEGRGWFSEMDAVRT